MAKDTFYFSHDYNARTDQKIKDLIHKHRMTGYGIFWAIIEDLYNNANLLRLNYERIAEDLRSDTFTIKSIINDFGLFEIDGDTFSSNSVQERLDRRNEKSDKARESAKARWMRSQTDGNAIKERKGKEIKYSSKEESISVDDSKKNKGLKRRFENTEYIDFDKFRAALPDWDDMKCKDYYNAALLYSKSKGATYSDWIATVQNWDRMEQKKKDEKIVKPHESAKRDRKSVTERGDKVIRDTISKRPDQISE